MVEVASSNLAGPTKLLSLCFTDIYFSCSLSRRELFLPSKGSAKKARHFSGVDAIDRPRYLLSILVCSFFHTDTQPTLRLSLNKFFMFIVKF